MQFRAGQAHAIHAFELERRFDPALDLGLCQAAFEFELIENRETLGVGFQAELLTNRRGHEQDRSPGVDDEVERPLAVDLDPHQDVLGIGQAVRDDAWLASFFLIGGPDGDGQSQGQDEQEPARMHI